MNTTTFSTGKDWLQQKMELGEYVPLVRKHLIAVLVGACVASLIFCMVIMVRSDHKDDIAKRELPSSLTSTTPVSSGAVYTRWGRTTCPEPGSQRVYQGYAAGSHFQHNGGGANILCLPNQPEWGTKDDTVRNLGTIYGMEYETPYGTFPFQSTNVGGGGNLKDYDMLCAVCKSTERTTSLMIPAKKTCPDGWNIEYWGYLTSERHTHKRSEYICVDEAPEADQAGYQNENGALAYPVEAKCGSLPCPPYVDGWELTCVVCTK